MDLTPYKSMPTRHEFVMNQRLNSSRMAHLLTVQQDGISKATFGPVLQPIFDFVDGVAYLYHAAEHFLVVCVHVHFAALV